MKFFAAILLATAVVSKSSCIPEPPEPRECVAQRGIPCTFAKCGECGSAGGTYDQHADCTIVVHCGLAGGSWKYVEPAIRSQLTEQGIPVTVYDLPHSTF